MAVLLHVLFLSAFLFGGGHRPVQHFPRPLGIGAHVGESSEDTPLTVVFLDDPSVANPAEASREAVASRGTSPRDPLVTIASAEPLPTTPLQVTEDSKDPAAAFPADGYRTALLFGRYMDQIRARIERAWTRPRTPISGGLFECRVRITQNRRGEVLEVALERCNGDARWQGSLVSAIQGASPLSAPPDNLVFTESFALEFQSVPYRPDGSAQGYEPEVVGFSPPPGR